MKRFIILILISIIFFAGCATTEGAAVVEQEPQKTFENSDLETLALYTARMSLNVNDPIESIDYSTIITEYDPLPEVFSDAVVTEVEYNYFFEGEERFTVFELIYSGVVNPVEPGEISIGDIVGYAGQPEISLVARTSDLDILLVGSSDYIPNYYDGYWYYFPGLYLPNQMKWPLFEPANYESFKEMYEHALDPEIGPGITSFNWWVYLETTLDEYPELMTEKGQEKSEQLIYFNDLPLRLSYQEGFYDYLIDEYILGEPIYLFLQISSVSAFTEEFDCYVRDFALISPEEIIYERMDHIQSQMQ